MCDSSMNCGRCFKTSTSISHIDDRLLELKDLPCLNITSPITNTPHLNDLDIDLNLPSDNNFAYYTTNDYHNNHDINECLSDPRSFSALHCNIRSLVANRDNLVHMLSSLYFPFSLIGLSEMKFRDNQDPLTIIQIAGYEFVSKPSLSNAGGVAFYIKKNLNFKIKDEISVTDSDFESLWIEIESVGQMEI